MSLKIYITKYIYYKPHKRISAYEVYLLFQFFQIYFNSVIQDTIYPMKAVRQALHILFPSYLKLI